MIPKEEYDVIICGAGIAGLTLARQLTMEMPGISLLLIEGTGDKSRTNALQVGESTIEVSARYLADVVGLKNYLETRHYHKWGFRFFFGHGETPFHERPELGISHAPFLNSYQLDRALLETNIKDFNTQMGIQMLEESEVNEINLNSQDGLHEVHAVEKRTKRSYTFKCRWVIDAMGRRRFLQKKLSITEPHNPHYSAAWFRVKGCIDVCDFVPQSEITWHTRVLGNNRYYSTNHLMANGRWVWLIPLASGQTSIGIVAQEDFFPFPEFNTYERAIQWLQKHEPILWRRIHHIQPVDFQCLRHYSYSAKQVFSIQRWACTGDAAVFSDPFRSPGLDQVGFANTLITEMVKRDVSNQLEERIVNHFNESFLGFHKRAVQAIHSAYPFFGNGLVCGVRLVWDFLRAFSVTTSQRFNNTYLDEQKNDAIQPFVTRILPLVSRVERLFEEWNAKTSGQYTYGFVDYFSVPRVLDIYKQNSRPYKTVEELVADHHKILDSIEETAQIIFLMAVADCMPEMLSCMPSPLWLNAWAVGLDPERWEADGLFTPTSKPRLLMVEQFSSMFGMTGIEKLYK